MEDFDKSAIYQLKQEEFTACIWKEYLKKNKDFSSGEKELRFYIFEIEKGLKEYEKDDFYEKLKGHYYANTKVEYIRWLDKITLKSMDIEVIIWIKSENKRLSDSKVVSFEECKLCAVFDYMPPEVLSFKDDEMLAYISRNSIR